MYFILKHVFKTKKVLNLGRDFWLKCRKYIMNRFLQYFSMLFLLYTPDLCNI